jgi:hypothetical protein
MKRLTLSLFILLSGLILQAQATTGFVLLKNVTALTYVDATCPDLSTCFYQVTSLDSSGHESAPALCASGSLCYATNQVVAQMPSSGTHTVTLSWIAPTGPAPASYNVYQHIGPLPPSGLGAIVN